MVDVVGALVNRAGDHHSILQLRVLEPRDSASLHLSDAGSLFQAEWVELLSLAVIHAALFMK
jgi:hypothetical protein